MNNLILGSLTGLALALAALLTLPGTIVWAEPRTTEEDPAYGDVLGTLPEFLHLCFSEPVKVDDDEDWQFAVRTPDGRALGLRIVFEPSGNCVNVFPGAPEEPPQGIWTFDWLVTSRADDSQGSGVIKFQLGDLQPGETPLEKPDPADSNDDPGDGDGDGSSTWIYLAVAAGVGIIVLAAGGFALSRRRRP